MMQRRACLGWVALALSGCATVVPEDTQRWSGRMALRVHGTAPQSFSAAFELSGSPNLGELQLISPIGTTLALLRWRAGQATLQRGDQWQEADSLDALIEQLLGTPVPVAALFDWLRGEATLAQGWSADTSGIAAGRLSARRHSPEPAAELRVVLSP